MDTECEEELRSTVDALSRRTRAMAMMRTGVSSTRLAWGDPMLRTGHLLTSSAVLSAVVGVAYWTVVARSFDAAVVGRSSALLSAMLLLGGIGQLNLMSALLRFLPIAGAASRRFVWACYGAAGAVTAVLATGFVLLAPRVSPSLGFVDDSIPMAIAFIGACVASAVFVLQDSVLTALRRPGLLVAENLGFSLLKVVLVLAFAASFHQTGVLLSWWTSLMVTVVVMNGWIFRRGLVTHETDNADVVPVTRRAVARFAGPDSVGELSWMAATNAMPFLVLARLGAEQTAYFGVTVEVANVLFMLGTNMGQSLVVATAADQSDLAHRWRRLVSHAAMPLLAAATVIGVGAPWLLSVFGPAYAANGTTLLRLLALAALPALVTATAVSAARAHRRTATASTILMAMCAGVIGLSAVLLEPLGLAGVGVAWLATQIVLATVLLIRPTWWLRIDTPPQSDDAATDDVPLDDVLPPPR